MAKTARATGSVYEDAARARKACFIADVLLELGIAPEATRLFTAEQRQQVERKAGVRDASDRTWAVVRTLMEHTYRRGREPVPLEIPRFG